MNANRAAGTFTPAPTLTNARVITETKALGRCAKQRLTSDFLFIYCFTPLRAATTIVRVGDICYGQLLMGP